MKPGGRIIVEAWDRSEHYPLIWDETLELGLLSRGALTARQGGKAYAWQGTASPPSLVEAPTLSLIDPRPALDTLAAAIHALAVPADNSAALAALQIAVKAVQGTVSSLPSAAAIKAALTAGAGTLGPAALTQTDGTGGEILVLWLQGNAGDTPPTLTYNGKPVAVVPVLNLAP